MHRGTSKLWSLKIIKNKSQKYHFSKKGPNMKKKLFFVANFHSNMEDNVYAYNSWSSFGDIGKVLHLPLSGFSFMQCKKKNHCEMPGLLKMFLLQKKRLSWISKKASDISPKRILGYTNQYRVFRRHKSIKAWKWLRTKVLVFFSAKTRN